MSFAHPPESTQQVTTYGFDFMLTPSGELLFLEAGRAITNVGQVTPAGTDYPHITALKLLEVRDATYLRSLPVARDTLRADEIALSENKIITLSVITPSEIAGITELDKTQPVVMNFDVCDSIQHIIRAETVAPWLKAHGFPHVINAGFASLIINKLAFKLLAEQHGLPIPKTFLCSANDPVGIIDALNSEIDTFILKPIGASKAIGVCVVQKEELQGVYYYLATGRATLLSTRLKKSDEKTRLAHLKKTLRSNTGQFLVQRCIIPITKHTCHATGTLFVNAAPTQFPQYVQAHWKTALEPTEHGEQPSSASIISDSKSNAETRATLYKGQAPLLSPESTPRVVYALEEDERKMLETKLRESKITAFMQALANLNSIEAQRAFVLKNDELKPYTGQLLATGFYDEASFTVAKSISDAQGHLYLLHSLYKLNALIHHQTSVDTKAAEAREALRFAYIKKFGRPLYTRQPIQGTLYERREILSMVNALTTQGSSEAIFEYIKSCTHSTTPDASERNFGKEALSAFKAAQYDTALFYYELAEQLESKQTKPKKREVAIAVRNQAVCLDKLGQRAKAITRLERALGLAEGFRDMQINIQTKLEGWRSDMAPPTSATAVLAATASAEGQTGCGAGNAAMPSG